MLAYVFPGQGSQVVGMGKDLFDEFKEYVDAADEILGYSIKELCLEDPNGVLGLTQYTQPALYVVNALTYLKEVKTTGVKPDFVAGHSLGEYDALFAAGVFDFETGLKLVQKRGELMSQAKGGGMAAVLGLKEEEIRKVLKEKNLSSIDIANLNSPSQTVISGLKEDIEAAQTIFEEAGALRYVVLKVSGAFHSRYMKEAQEKFGEFLNQFEFKKPEITVISNLYARPYKAKNLRETLLGQITSSVRWTETIRYIWGKDENVDIVQIGPGNVLKGLTRGIKRDCQPLIVNDEDDFDDTDDAIEESGVEIEELNSSNSLGSKLFKERYGLNYAYAAGPMYCEVSSKEFVETMAKSRMLSFYGTAGVELSKIEEALEYLKKNIGDKASYGANIMPDIMNGEREGKIVDLLLKYDVKTVLASFYINMTPELIRYKVNGLKRDSSGKVVSTNRVIAKLSRPEVLNSFLSPIPSEILSSLLSENKITKEQFDMAQNIPVADDVCVISDSAGNTDMGVAYTMIPTMVNLRNDLVSKHNYSSYVCIGCAGGIGTPDAIVAAVMLGAEFVMTGSINQCTVEAKTSDTVKNMLQEAEIQDTEYIVSGDNFEFGTKSQIFRKGVLFHVRATKLYETYKLYNSIDEIDDYTKKQIEERYFQKSFEQIYDEIKSTCSPIQLERMQSNPKYKMSMIFKWYFDNGTKLALSGNEDRVVDYMINCSSAMGAFNTYVKGTNLENWHNRNADVVGKLLMDQADDLLKRKISALKMN